MSEGSDLTRRVIAGAMQVHRALGPGLLESAYQTCLVYELGRAGLEVACEIPLEIEYRGIHLNCGYRLDLVVEHALIVELKSVRAFEPIHTAQMLTYLKLSGLPIGLLINFNVPLLKHGIRRVVRDSP